jgi:hypothetical protein
MRWHESVVSMINKIQLMETKAPFELLYASSFHKETDSSPPTDTRNKVIIADLRIILS